LTKHTGINQKWKIVYASDKQPARKKGLNTDFGLEINRPFYIRSRLPMNRVLEAISANNVVIKKMVKGKA